MTTAEKLPFQEDLPIDEVILFISRPNIRPVIRQEVKNIGIEKIHNAETLEGCIEAMTKYPDAMLVLDWEQGEPEVNEVLRSAQGAFSVDTRPIFLIAAEVSKDVVTIASEYNVIRVHTGEISRGAIKDHLDAVMFEESRVNGLRPTLVRVAEARARGDWQLAESLLHELSRRFPNNIRISCELADSLIQQEKWDDALSLLTELSIDDKSHLRAQHLLARCYMRFGRFEEATDVLKSCKLINPFHIERLIDLGNALINTHHIREARDTFDEVLNLDQNNKDAAIGKSRCQLVEGDVNAALSLLRKISGPRELASVFNNAAVLTIRQSHYERALTLYNAAIGAIGDLDRIKARLLFNMGVAYHKWNRPNEALECFEQSGNLDANFAKAIHNARVLATVLGRSVEFSEPVADDGQSKLIDDFSEDFDDEDLG